MPPRVCSSTPGIAEHLGTAAPRGKRVRGGENGAGHPLAHTGGTRTSPPSPAARCGSGALHEEGARLPPSCTKQPPRCGGDTATPRGSQPWGGTEEPPPLAPKSDYKSQQAPRWGGPRQGRIRA